VTCSGKNTGAREGESAEKHPERQQIKPSDPPEMAVHGNLVKKNQTRLYFLIDMFARIVNSMSEIKCSDSKIKTSVLFAHLIL
jgi:hypothetical protein